MVDASGQGGAPEFPGRYDFTAIEQRWQGYWEKHRTFKTPDPGPVGRQRPKYYILDMFPYPSGDGLHVGHPEGYTATDILARYKRMRGFNVLHPMGWDAFGLPAEQHALRTGSHPRVTMRRNVDRFRQQIKSIGLSYDWDREINTTDPAYFKWTQWIFLKLFEKGLAYEDYRAVNWCPALGTVLANEEVVDGKSEVGGHPVVQKPMRQWVLKITAYAERLLQDLEGLDWPESVKEMQRNWIGRSEGAFVTFKVVGGAQEFSVFTTRPDTLFGATFCVLAPEHPLVPLICMPSHKKAVEIYQQRVAAVSDLERTSGSKQKTGEFTGAYAINPVNGEHVPIYIADYVLATYGTGALMAVPGHDARDHEFARLFGLAIKRVLTGGAEDIQEAAHSGDGTLVNSGFLDGLGQKEAVKRMVQWLEANGAGRGAVNYKLRDWIFSRQRYWGEPIPLMKDPATGAVAAVPEAELPLCLPDMADFKPSPDGEPPLGRAKEWVDHKDAAGRSWQRETNTMPQWAGSCWYYLRYIDPHNDQRAWDVDKEKYWMPVDLYVGGVEHAVMHLLYARFWHKVLYDAGYVSTPEPFASLRNQGMILGENNEKMSKSRGNVVNPDEVIREWGADSFRLYEMFMGPLEAAKPWQTNGIVGVHRFLQRVWRLYVDEKTDAVGPSLLTEAESEANIRALHRLIKKVTEDTEAMQFNTAIAAMMEFVNFVYKSPGLSLASARSFVLLLAPYAPHAAEELWQRLGGAGTLAYEPWPSYLPDLAKLESVTIAVSVNGKLRTTLSVAADAGEEEVKSLARAQEAVLRSLEGKTPVKEVYVAGKILNFVVKG